MKNLEATRERFKQLLVNTPGFNPERVDFVENSVSFWFDRNYIYKNPAIVSLSEAKKVLDRDEYDDFVYIRPWSVVFFDVTGLTSHEIFLAAMWAFFDACKTNSGWRRNLYDMCYRNPDNPAGPRERLRDNAELFLSDHYGFYSSSAYSSSGLSISESFVKTAQEKQVFKGFKFREVVD